MTDKKPHKVVSTPGSPMKCVANTKRGAKCKQWALVGLDKCKHHCGLSREEREKRGKEEVARHLVADLAKQLRPDLHDPDPSRTLMEALTTDIVMVTVLRHQVGQLDVKHGADDALYGDNHRGDSTQHVLAEMLKTWTDQMAKHSKMAIDAGISERRLMLEEELAARLMTVQGQALRDAGLNQTQIRKVNTAMVTRLRVLEGGKAS